MHLSISGSVQVTAMLAALAVGTASFAGFAQPGSAETLSNIILGTLAANAQNVIFNPIPQGQIAPNTVIGRTRDGGTVYSDGRVIYPNGDVLYTSNGNGQPCSYVNTYNRCANPGVYYPRKYNGQNHGHHYGWYKHHGDRDDQRNNNATYQKHHENNDDHGNRHGNNENGHGEGHGHNHDKGD